MASNDPLLGSVELWPINFAPRGWAFCSGQLLPIAQNTALFSLLGTTYGGDGRTSFGLPDLRGRVPVGQGLGPGLSNYALGERGGLEGVTLTQAELAVHAHALGASVSTTLAAGSAAGTAAVPEPTRILAAHADAYSPVDSANSTLGGISVTGGTDDVGGGQSHENRPPYLSLHYIIALIGIYPSRS